MSTAYEQRNVIRFLWSKGRTPIEIQRGMQPTYVERCLALRSLRWWWSEFENGSENLNDNERAGGLRVSVTNHNTARVGAMLKTDRRVRIKDIAQELDISFRSAFNFIHECLGYRKASCRWVPKQLDDVMKGKRMIASLNHIQRYAEEGDNFLDRIVTGDETWVLHYTPESKQQNMVWKHPQSPVKKEIRYCAICLQSDVNGILGLPWTARAGFHATRFHNHCRQMLFHTVTSAGCDQKEAPQDCRC